MKDFDLISHDHYYLTAKTAKELCGWRLPKPGRICDIQLVSPVSGERHRGEVYQIVMGKRMVWAILLYALTLGEVERRNRIVADIKAFRRTQAHPPKTSKKEGPIVDTRNYIVVIGGVRHGNLTLNDARKKSEQLVREWAELGPRREAKIYYRDGSLVETVGYSDLYPQ